MRYHATVRSDHGAEYTYTERTALEMQERLEHRMGDIGGGQRALVSGLSINGSNEAHIYTTNGWFARVWVD